MNFGTLDNGHLERRLGTWCLGVALCLSVTVNVLQVVEIRSVNSSLRRARAGHREREIVGTRARSLSVHDLAGRPITLPVAAPGKMTVVYVFSPRCGWCRRNLANLRALIGASGSKYDFLPISLNEAGLQKYWSEAGLAGPVYANPSRDTQDAYGLGATPQTIVVGSDGRVARNWKGAYTGRLLTEVSELLDVQLPGLPEGQ
jgi:hypothetical protein